MQSMKVGMVDSTNSSGESLRQMFLLAATSENTDLFRASLFGAIPFSTLLPGLGIDVSAVA